MSFDFKKSLIKVQGGRSYLPVSARIVWFRQEHPDWGIETEPIEINHEKQFAVFRARIYNAEGKLMAMGTKKEDVKGFPDFMEKAETGAVGRALALCGFGTQFSPELDEVGGGRLADSPQPTGGGRYGGGNSGGNYGGSNRFGNGPQGSSNGDGARFSPPREVSPPPVEARPAPSRPLPSNNDEGEDDFEALVNSDGLREATEDDPFGDEANVAAARPAPAGKSEAPAMSSNGTPACGGCGKALTKAQQELSIRNYGEALCPGCQKDKSRRSALAER
jgi:hypothetical protein